MTTVCGVGLATKEGRGLEFYATHRVAVDSILSIEHMPGEERYWEPFCGDGAIVKPMRREGYKVFASDIIDRGCPKSSVMDFFGKSKRTADTIISNPPFSRAQEAVEVGLERADRVIYLLRLSFLEGFKRRPWFEAGYLSRLYVASRRLPMMHREGYEGKRSGSAVCHAWFVWDKHSRARSGPVVKWFDYKEHSKAFVAPANDNQIDLEEAIDRAA
jgi:hypothetical protein